MSVEHYFVGAFKILEYAVESLISNLPWQAFPQFFFGWIGFGFSDSVFNHQYSIKLRFMKNFLHHYFYLPIGLCGLLNGTTII